MYLKFLFWIGDVNGVGIEVGDFFIVCVYFLLSMFFIYRLCIGSIFGKKDIMYEYNIKL